MSDLKRKARLDDVAELAGVSTATVSRFFNNPDVVATATADRIRAAVDELGYVPNLLAGGLASNRSRLAAVFVPHITDSIFNHTVEAMIGEFYGAGLVVMLGVSGMQDGRINQLVHAALGRRADAIVLTGIVTEESLREELRRSDTTVIETWGLPEEPIDIAVGFSHQEAGEEIARFLHRRGYQRLHMAMANTARSRVRRDATMAEWVRLGGELPTIHDLPPPLAFGQARAVFSAMRRMEAMPDVVVCGSDAIAQGMIVEANAHGLSTPDDIAVFGFGNHTLAGDMRPTITTVEVDGSRIARETLRALTTRAAGGDIDERSIDVGFRLIARDSA